MCLAVVWIMITQVQRLSPLWLFEPCMLWMNSNLKAYDWTLLGMEAQNCFLNESKPNTWAHQRCMKTWATSKAKNSQDVCLPSVSLSHFKQIPKDHDQGSNLPSASPSHFIIIKVQAYQVLSILNGPRRSKWPNFASLHIWFATSWFANTQRS